MTENSKGRVKISSQMTWSRDEHPDALDQHPTLELRIELTGYTSRKDMADMLRILANAVDEGELHPFDRPTVESEVNGVWDDENKQWIITEDDDRTNG